MVESYIIFGKFDGRVFQVPLLGKNLFLVESCLYRQVSIINNVSIFRFGGGLIMDIKRKAKCYKSDFVDALNSQCLASVLFIYFACLAPIVTFGGVMETKTNKYMVKHCLLFPHFSSCGCD